MCAAGVGNEGKRTADNPSVASGLSMQQTDSCVAVVRKSANNVLPTFHQ